MPGMRRREFVSLLGGAAAAWPLAARAQQPATADHRVLGSGTPSTHGQWFAAFVQRLRELGWIEGRTVAIEYRWAEGRSERFAEIAAEFVRLKVDVIVTSGAARCPRQSRRHRSSRSSSRWRRTRSAAAWSRVWRGRAATSPACRSNRPIWLASGSNFCARLSPVFAGWRSWPMSAVPAAVLEMGEVQAAARTLGLEVVASEIRRAEDIAPAFEALKGRADALYVVRRPARSHQPDSHQHLGARRATADDVHCQGVRRSGRSDVLWAKLSRTCSGAPPTMSTRFCAGRSQPTSRSSSRPSSIWSST